MLLEQQSKQGMIDLLYADESQVCEEGYVPYGWQFAHENVCIQTAKGSKVNIFAMISRSNQFFYQTCRQKVTACFIVEQLERFSFSIDKPTVVVLDNARIHTARKVKERLTDWQARGLYLFYLPPYCPHLNICERVWRELKARWLKPEDYLSAENLFYTLTLALSAIGKDLFINFSDLYL